MNYIKKVCSFTGYRPQKLNACLAQSSLTPEILRDYIKSELHKMLDRDFEIFQCGMAIGADLLFAKAVLELKKECAPYPVKFHAVIPCFDHDAKWWEADRAAFLEITEQADEVIYVSKTPYFNGCMAKRNRYLIDTCDELMAVFDGQQGGTMQTINYAKQKGKRIMMINPAKELKITLFESDKTTKAGSGKANTTRS